MWLVFFLLVTVVGLAVGVVTFDSVLFMIQRALVRCKNKANSIKCVNYASDGKSNFSRYNHEKT